MKDSEGNLAQETYGSKARQRVPNEFIADFSVKGMIHALTIRSPIASGSLKEIAFPELPPSYYLITAEHIPGENRLADFPVEVLAEKKLSYIGQPLAILAGPDKFKLEELFSQIKVIAEEESPEFSRLHESAGQDTSQESIFHEDLFARENVVARRDIEQGNPTYQDERKIVSGVYRTGIQEHWYPEAHGVAAVPSLPERSLTAGKKTQGITIYTATQWPFHVKRSIACLLGMEGESITVSPTLLNQHLDGKIWYPSLLSCHAALAAWISKYPVKLMLSREEDFLYSPKRNAAEIKMNSDLDDKGAVIATEISLALDLGAGEIFQDELIDQTCIGAAGIYRLGALKIKAIGLQTNIPPQGPMAGFGLGQGFFASERHISRIADTLGQDPAEWRKKNVWEKKQGFAIGAVPKDTIPIIQLIDTAASMSDYHRKWASNELLRIRRRGESFSITEPIRGIGIATGCQGTGFLNNCDISTGNCTVEITLEKDGFLEIRTSLASSGTWHLNNWQQLVEEILGLEPALVRISCDTTKTPDSGPGTLSRAIGITSKLVERCLLAIRKQRFRDPLPITVKRSDTAFKAPGWHPDKLIDTESFAHPGWGAAIAEIEIDRVTFEPTIRGIWLAVDAGKLLNEKRGRRVLKTSAIHALGWTCREQLRYVDGKIPQDNYHNYDIPAPEEMPQIEISFINSDSAVCKGIGDLPFSCIPAAYVQAVSQAMDYHFESIPLDAGEIWRAWKLKQSEGV